MMNGISSKVGLGAAAGAVTIVLVWIASMFGLVVPGEVASAITVLITAIVGFAVPETATTNVEDTTTKEVVSTNPADVDTQPTLL
jgi:hypothetical protein